MKGVTIVKTMKNMAKGMLQIGFFIIVSLLMNWISSALHLPIPGSILGIFFIFFLLRTKIIKLEWVDLGSKWLLAEMLLFFIPPAAGMIQYKSLLVSSGLRILLVVLCSTVMVMIGAGIVAETITRKKEKHRDYRHSQSDSDHRDLLGYQTVVSMEAESLSLSASDHTAGCRPSPALVKDSV